MIQFRNENITVFQSALYQTTSSVVEGEDFVLVVDPNWLPHEIEEIQQHVARVRGEKELYLLFTHGDYDHIIGYQAFPDAQIIGSKGLQEHPNKEQTLDQIRQFDHDFYIKRSYLLVFPIVDWVIEEDGQQLIIGDSTLTFYLAPGHTHDGLFTLIEPLGIWLAGDYLSYFELPFIDDSAKEYETTLRKAESILENHSVSLMVPGHGQTTSSHAEIQRRIHLSQSYMERLTAAVTTEDVEAMAALEKEMAFPSEFTKKCHEKNVELIRRGLKL